MSSPPVFVVGAGAVGLHLAARLSAVASVTLVARGPRVATLAREGFALEGAAEGRFRLPVRDMGEPLPPEADVLLAVKASQLAVTLPLLQLHPGQPVGLCQNGLGVAALARSALPHATLVRVACWLGSTLVGPLRVRVGGSPQLELACDDPAAVAPRDRFAGLLRAAGFPAQVAGDVASCEWRRSLWHLAVSGLCAALGERSAAVVESPPLQALARVLLDEVRAVAAAEGVTLTDDDVDRVFASTRAAGEQRNPMVLDLARGDATEMPFLNAEVARRAAAAGLPALVNAVVARLVEHCERRGAEARRRGPGAAGPEPGPA
jgi:2-dehydropantoate 2-reductase